MAEPKCYGPRSVSSGVATETMPSYVKPPDLVVAQVLSEIVRVDQRSSATKVTLEQGQTVPMGVQFGPKLWFGICQKG